MYAIIESCGRQYKVAEGEVVFLEKLEDEEGKKVTFDNVVLVSDGKKVQVGNPYVKGIKVEGKVISHGKGKKITFDNVILVSEDGKVQVGNPYVKGVKVEGKVVSHGKHKKIIVFKMKAKQKERKKQGHRQPYTKVEITSIKLATAKNAETKATETKKEETTKKSEAKVEATANA